MKEDNIHNILYFENLSMKGLFDDMSSWQKENKKRFLSSSIQKDQYKYCCICLTNPSEVTIVGPNGNRAEVTEHGALRTLKAY